MGHGNSVLGVITKLLKGLPSIGYSIRFEWTGMSSRWVFFSEKEVEGLNEEFVSKLDMARKIAGIPFVITSGLRTPEKNLSVVGAVPDSAHLKGLAVDLRVSSSNEVALIVDAAKAAGITRRGIYVDWSFKPTHIHLDDDPEKIQECIWIKMEGDPFEHRR